MSGPGDSFVRSFFSQPLLLYVKVPSVHADSSSDVNFDDGDCVIHCFFIDGTGSGQLRRTLHCFKNTQGQNITVEDIRAEERRLGLDRPFLIRAFSWMGDVFF